MNGVDHQWWIEKNPKRVVDEKSMGMIPT